MLVTGVGLITANPWHLLFAILTGLLIDRMAIRREEVHLAANFSDEWQEYAARVRRWL